MKILKVIKKFKYGSEELRIVIREEDYMNSPDKVNMTRVITKNYLAIPISINRGETQKSIVSRVTELLDGLKKRGCDVIKELNKKR